MNAFDSSFPDCPQPREGDANQSKILLEAAENAIPGVTYRNPAFLAEVKELLSDPQTGDGEILLLLKKMQQKESFDLDLLFHLLLGIKLILQEQRLQSLPEVDLFLQGHKEMFCKKLAKPLGGKVSDQAPLNRKNNQQKLNM